MAKPKKETARQRQMRLRKMKNDMASTNRRLPAAGQSGGSKPPKGTSAPQDRRPRPDRRTAAQNKLKQAQQGTRTSGVRTGTGGMARGVKENLSGLSNLNCSIVFFISAKKLNRNLNVIKEFFSERNIVICKEITKYYEEFFRSKVSDLKAFKNLRGEITIVISELNNKKKASNNLNESDKKKIGMLIKKLSTKEIVNLLNYEKNISKKEIYNYCLSLKK